MSFLVSSEARSLYPQETDGRSSQQTFYIIAENCRNWFWFTPHGECRVCTEHLHLLLPLRAAKAGLLTLPPHSSWAGNDALQKMQSHGFASTLTVILLWGYSLKNFRSASCNCAKLVWKSKLVQLLSSLPLCALSQQNCSKNCMKNIPLLCLTGSSGRWDLSSTRFG